MVKNLSKNILITINLSTLSLAAHAVETGITIGAHDFVVTDITPSSIYDGSTSNTFGINAGAFIKHTTASDIVLGGTADFFLEHSPDHLDSDHFPLWYKFHVYGSGPIDELSEVTTLKWLVDFKNKQNTASGVEREIKIFYGLGLDFTNEKSHLALNGYGGFYYLEIDDDAPREYAGYDREDLDDGTSAVSIMLEGSVKLSDNFTFAGSATNWTSLGVGSNWLENELMAEINYNSDNWVKNSTFHLKVLYTLYNLDGYYREDLGKPVLPWDNDTLIRAYMSIPWEFK